MNEQKRILRVLEKSTELSETVQEQTKPKFAHPNQSDPIYKNWAQFNNIKIGDKWSIRDLLR